MRPISRWRVSLQAARLHSERFREVAGSVFSSITAGYEMKMRHVAPTPDSYRWHNVDRLVEFAEANQMQVHGHTLGLAHFDSSVAGTIRRAAMQNSRLRCANT